MSPVLASALSSFHVKSQLFFEDFSSDCRVLQYESKLLRILGSSSEIANLKTSILWLKWMNLDFLHQCMPLFLKFWLSYSKVHELKRTKTRPQLTWRTKRLALSYKYLPQASGIDRYSSFYQIRSAQWWYGNKNLLKGTGLPDGWVSVHSARSRPIWLQRRALFDLDSCLIPE